MESIQQRIKDQELRAEEFQREGKYLDAMEIYEEIITLKRNAYGESHEDYLRTSYKICDICNLIAMIFLQKQKFQLALDMLKKALSFAMKSSPQLAATYNNFACYYRKINKLRVSLDYLRKALSLELKLHTTKGLSDTHLNLCAVLSQLGKHDQALEHVLVSVIYLQDQLLGRQDASVDRISVLVIAYHNMGVELQYLKRKEQAILTYRKAVTFGEAKLGPQNALVQNLKEILNTAQQTLSFDKHLMRPETKAKLERVKSGVRTL